MNIHVSHIFYDLAHSHPHQRNLTTTAAKTIKHQAWLMAITQANMGL